MNFKKFLREPLLYLLPLLAILFLAIVFMHPEISNVKLTRNNATENIELPYLVNDMPGNEVFFISLNLTLKNKTAKFNIVPDDCIQEILINGKKFPLDGIQGICNCEKGAHFDFSEYVQKGMNYFEFNVINSGGGPAGFNVKTYGGINQFSLIHYIFVLIFLISVVLILIKIKPVFAVVKKQIISSYEFSAKQHKIIFGLIFFFAVALRLYGFGDYPAGLNQDEAIMAYDAYADSFYGMDQNGNHNSVYNVSWGGGQSMGYNYVMRPFIKVFGLNIITVRLPMLILSIISLVFFYLLLKELFFFCFSLLGLFLLAFNPWHIMISRWALDCNLAPLIFLPAIYFAIMSYKKPAFFILSMFLFGCAGYGYAALLMLYVVFIPFMIWHVFRHKTVPVKYAISGFLTFGLVSLPLAMWMIINTFNFPAFKFLWLYVPRMTVLRSASTVSFELDNFKRFGEFMITGNDGLISNAISPFGPLYSFMLAFILFGIYFLFVKYKGKASEVKFWFISAVILALAINININRINMIFFPFIFLATLGIAEINRQIKCIAPILASLVIVMTICFANVYFTTFNQNNQYMYFNQYDHAIEYAIQNTEPTSTIYISGVNAPYVFALYVTKLHPQKFINTVVYANPGGEIRHVMRFDRFVTAVPHVLNSGETGVFHRNEVHNNMRNQAKKITPFGNFLVVEN
jgi:4-amino-4-deoxy-L-arabinose transferase-like glycosyltransferase